MYKKVFLFFSLFFLFSCSENNENITPQNNTPDIEVTKISDLDLVKKYFDYLSKKDYLSAYSLKKTDKTLENFKSVYSDSESFIKYSSEKLDNGNIKSINIIDNIPYEGIFEVIDGRIKTVSAGEMKDSIYKNGKLRKKLVSEKYPDFNYFLDDDSYNFNWDKNYRFVYYPENDKKLYREEITLKRSSGAAYSSYELKKGINEIINGKIELSKRLFERYSDFGEYEDNGDFEGVEIEDIDGRKLIIQNYKNLDKFYIFAERINKDNVILYTGFNTDTNLYNKGKIKEIFNEFEEERLSKLKKGDCYIHQGNMNCLMDDGKEFIRIKEKDIDASHCELHLGKIFMCDDFMRAQNTALYDIYFLNSKKIVKPIDFGYIHDGEDEKNGFFKYNKIDNGIEILYFIYGIGKGIKKFYDINGDIKVENNFECEVPKGFRQYRNNESNFNCKYVEEKDGKITKGIAIFKGNYNNIDLNIKE